MSDYIPLDTQLQIIKRLPVKPLIQFRSVSKAWKSLIDSSGFIAGYSGQMQLLYVCSDYPLRFKKDKYVLVVDDHTFPQHKLSVPPPDSFINYPIIYGCSHGVMCLYGDLRMTRGGHISPTSMVVLWNPSIRKMVSVVVPHEEFEIYESKLGFGVCRETMDPKIVKIRYIKRWDDVKSIACIPWQVEVFSLSIGMWRSPHGNLPCKSIQINRCSKVVEVDGFLYWLANDRIVMDGGFRSHNFILSFDITSEEFKEINLPDSLAHQNDISLVMHKRRESLVVVLDRGSPYTNDLVFTVWMMKDGVSKSFTKLFTLNGFVKLDACLTGFRKSGEPLIQISDIEDEDIEDDDHVLLVVYDPHSKQIDNLGIDGIGCAFQVFPYTETLLLLDHPNFVVYNDI